MFCVDVVVELPEQDVQDHLVSAVFFFLSRFRFVEC